MSLKRKNVSVWCWLVRDRGIAMRMAVFFGVAWNVLGSLSAESVQPDIYGTTIKPLLRTRCYACHGALQQMSGLRLDTVSLMLQGGDSGPAIQPREPLSSILIQRVSATDSSQRMPPEHEGETLSAEQIAQILAWITSGAQGPADEQPEPDPKQHWAYRPIVRPAPPPTADPTWVRNPIDMYLSEQHHRMRVEPQEVAPRAVLVRRLYLDLVGLPPTFEEITRCLGDRAPDWYERLVDRLLADPRHGERWARHWMDIWRYSDWWGLGPQLRNSQKHIWHWRDWILESLNEDVSYSDMVRLMLAVDEIHPNDLGQLRASGYLARNYFLFNRNQWMDEVVEHVSKGFLGLSMNCAKCHDHKYDPLRQVDYYALRAVFEPYHVRLDMVPGQGDLEVDGIPRAYDGVLDVATYRLIRGQESTPDRSVAILPNVPPTLQLGEFHSEAMSLPVSAWRPERRAWVLDAHRALVAKRLDVAGNTLERVREKWNQDGDSPELRATLQVEERAYKLAQAELKSVELRAAAMSAAWAEADSQIETPSNAVQANGNAVPAHVAAASVAARSEREVAVAKADLAVAEAERKLLQQQDEKKKPELEKSLLSAREDLEKATKNLAVESVEYQLLPGAVWTATRFLSSVEDDPRVAFPSTSSGRRSALAAWILHPQNPLTARVAVNHLWTRHLGTSLANSPFDFGRKSGTPSHTALLDLLASEFLARGWSMKHMHRMIVTSAAYQMSSSQLHAEENMGRDPDNRFWWRRNPIRLEAQVVRDSVLRLADGLDFTQGGPTVPPESQATSPRRSLYFFHSNNSRNLFLTTFDDASVKECYRREQSVVPQQALALANSGLTRLAARTIAERITANQATHTPGSVDHPTDADRGFIRDAFGLLLGIVPSEAEVALSHEALLKWQALASSNDGQNTAQVAREHLVWALLNHGDFVTLR